MRREDQRPDRDSDKLWEEFDAERTTVDTGELAQLSTNRDELIRLVGDALTEKFGERPAVDDDRDFVLHHMGQPVWIRVHADFPAITIMARVGHGVYSRRATEVELGILNRTATFSRWSLAGRDVWQETAMVALPFVPLHLSVLIDRFLQTMTSPRDDLAYRTGAKVA